MIYDFDEQLEWSKEALRQHSDEATLKLLFPRSAGVRKTSEKEDRAGVDYVVTLRRGAELKVDAKTRRRGCSRHWRPRDEPEVALELWSVRPGGKFNVAKGVAGWTLDESKDVDLILYTFHPDDHQVAYVRSLPLLREAFRRNCKGFLSLYKTDIQETAHGGRRWESECVFVPLSVVDQAIAAASRTQLVRFHPETLAAPPAAQADLFGGEVPA